MSQVKKLEHLLKQLEDSRKKLKEVSQGGFIGIGHARRNASFDKGGSLKVEVVEPSMTRGKRKLTGGAFLGTKGDSVGANKGLVGAQRKNFYGEMNEGREGGFIGVKKGGSVSGGGVSGGFLSGGYVSGGRRNKKDDKMKTQVEPYEDQEGGFLSGGDFSGVVGGRRSGGFLSGGDFSGVVGGRRSGGRASGGRPSGGYVSGGDFSGVVGGAKKKNPWIEHVKNYAKQHGVTYAQAISLAKDSYKC